ncbi:hypothetical protein AURDEDRAFT_83988 [Auricularia subglabra TFB-10046 SS5]|nr:hypothetical protein AURDEDRAFT_83988 [Auricularia subglabra TFB-10046 SS5]
MGPTGSGKSTIINKIVPGGARVGDTMVSCTSEVSFVDGDVDGVHVTFIDTPGFDDTHTSDTDTLRLIANCLELAYQERWLLSGIIYMQRITDNRVGGVSAKNMRMFRTLCGEDALRNVVLCTSMWDKVLWSPAEEQTATAREAELKADFWAPMLAHGSVVSRFHNTRESAVELVRPFLHRDGVPTKLQTELAGGIPLNETDTGKLVSEDLKRLEETHRREMEILRRDMALKHGRALAGLKKELDDETASARRAREELEKLGQQRDEEIKQLRAELKKSRDCC